MATLPYFLFSPNTVLSLAGLMRGSEKAPQAPACQLVGYTPEVHLDEILHRTIQYWSHRPSGIVPAAPALVAVA